MKIGFSIIVAMLLGFGLPGAVMGQSTTQTAGDPTASQAPASQSDVIVVGTPDGPFEVTTDSTSVPDLRVPYEEAMEDAASFAKCVKPFDNASLKELFDGLPNRQRRAQALDRIVRGYAACHHGADPGLLPNHDFGTCDVRQTNAPHVVVCQAPFNRGALIEKTIKQYAPNLNFTTEQLFAPDVLARFHAREDNFDKTRSRNEIVYAEVASCIVAIHPRLALAFLHTDLRSDSENRDRAALLGTSSQCLGGAKKVTVDPSQFRVYMADATYSWAIAFLNVVSLVPDTKQ